jgi:malonate transporter and related proteins
VGLIEAFGPIWILTAAGYLAQRRGLLAGNASLVLGQFVFHLAIPAALYLALAKTPLSGFDVRPLLAFAVSTALVLGAGWYGSWRWFGRKPGQRAIWGMAAGYVNSANLGIPIAMQVIGNVSFLVEVVLLQTLVVTPIILISLERSADAAGRIRLRRLASIPVRNPVILASALGVLASATKFQPPSVIESPLTLLGAAAVPTALIALGASLYRQSRIADAAQARYGTPPAAAADAGPGADTTDGPAADLAPTTEIAVISVLKLIAQPAIAYLIGVFALRLPQPELLAVVVCAGLPSAQNAFIFAQRYRAAQALAGRAVIVTTTLSMASIAAIAVLLGR